MSRFINTLISASAGSGKTFQLTLRYIKLLHEGVNPEKIIALTFTKKAAGEIYNKIIERLLSWNSNKEEMLRDCATENITGMSSERVFEILRKIIDSQHKLSISTLDSFFFKILKSFPYEYGTTSELEVIDDSNKYIMLENTLKELLLTQIPETERSTLFEAFKQATYGKEETRIYKILEDYINSHYTLFKKLNSQNTWGDLSIISEELLGDFEVNTAKAQATLDEVKSSTKVFEEFKTAILNANDFKEEFPIDNNAGTLFKKIAELEGGFLKIRALAKNNAPIQFNFRQKFSIDAEIVYSAAMKYLSCMLKAQSRKTKGIYNTLSLYSEKYNNFVKNTGRLAFDDILTFLQGKNLTGKTTSAPDQLYIDYRLDSCFDHWLIDEFQDTSKSQWNVIENLIDEVMSDNGEKKSFFYVGDVKQAIYSWRGGDSYLFSEIQDKYRQQFEERKLAKSYRSSEAVIETVNRVFHTIENIENLPSEVIELWKRNWKLHETAKKMEGYCAIYSTDEKRCKERNESNLPLGEIIEIINEVNPFEKNISVGILVLTNDQADEIEKYLTLNGIACSKEGKFKLADSPAVKLLLSLLKIIHHPGNKISLAIIELSKLCKELPNEDAKINLTLAVKQLLKELKTAGLIKFVSQWANIIKEKIIEEKSAIDRLRLDQTVYAAELYTGNKSDILSFVKYIENYQIVSKATDKCVQITTIHRSKGLEYDMVIIPKIKGKNILKSDLTDAVKILPDSNNHPKSAMLLPKRDIACADPVLSEYINRLDIKECYEDLCVLYVAITRAKKALYVFSNTDSDKSNTIYLSTIINRQLAGISDCEPPLLYEVGNKEWHQKKVSEKETITKLKTKGIGFVKPEIRQEISPSTTNLTESLNFISETENKAKNIGLCIHEIFEHLDWTDKLDLESFLKEIKIQNYYDKEILDTSIKKVRDSLNNSEIKTLFSRPSPNSILWKEKDFAIIHEGKLIKGRFDRVQIEKDSSGKTLKVFVIDYKYEESSSHEELKSNYENQIRSYKFALSKILKIPHKLISAFLILPRTSSIIKM